MGFAKARRWRLFARSRASVAIVIRDGEHGDEILLTLRAAREGDPWSGHISLPGGRAEPGEDAVSTAIRETREELGLDLAGRSIGRLGAHLTFEHGSWAGMAIDPVIFRFRAVVPPLELNWEVDEAFWVPIRELRSGKLDTIRPWRLLGRDWQMPAWDWEGHIIWGLTYSMLQEFLEDL